MTLRTALLVSGAATLLGVGVPASAQISSSGQATPPDSSQAAQRPADGDQTEIIVTAQRRSEALQRTPVAVSVLSGTTLANQAISSERDLQVAVPGLTVRASQNDNQLNYSLRGQTVDTYSNSLPAVLPYVNEVQVGGVGQSAFYDLQSVQVVKGPQGTLFGRNATGGAVLFTTAKPTEELSGYGSAGIGSYHEMRVEGAVGGAIVPDVLRVRVAGSYRVRDGYQRNLFYGSRLGDIDRKAGRVSVDFMPTSTIANNLVVDYLQDDGTSIVAPVYSVLPPGANVPGNPVVPNNVLIPGLVQAGIDQRARGPYRVNVDSLNSHHLKKLVVSNITSWKIGPDTTLKNVFGYVRTKFFDGGDIDGTQFGIDGRGTTKTGELGSFGVIRQYSDELQLLGKIFDDRLEYVVGGYAADIRDHTVNNSFIEAELGAPVQINAGTTRSRSIAGYTQATFDTGLAGFKLTGGVRYTSEEVTFTRDANDLYSPTANLTLVPFYADGRFIAPQKDTFSKLSWTAGINNQVTSSLLLYAKGSRSFRSGGFNNQGPPTPGFADQSGGEYRPEVATDVEGGAKYHGLLGTMPVNANLAVYHTWVDNVQRAFYGSIYGFIAATTVNVPQAQITGVEFDGNIRPVSWLVLGGNLNYTNARFTKNRVAVIGTDGTTAIAIYDSYPDTPRWSGLAYADVTAPLTERVNAVLHGDVFKQTSNYFSSTGRSLNPGTKIPGYTVANFRVGLEQSGGKGWALSGLVKNAFAKTYYTGGIGFASIFALNVAVPAEPRTFLVEARYRF